MPLQCYKNPLQIKKKPGLIEQDRAFVNLKNENQNLYPRVIITLVLLYLFTDFSNPSENSGEC